MEAVARSKAVAWEASKAGGVGGGGGANGPPRVDRDIVDYGGGLIWKNQLFGAVFDISHISPFWLSQ